MREIKFRAQYTTEDGVVVWKYFIIPNGFYVEDCEWQHFKNWCQFTGLKDKNGKEIYEGDIIREIKGDWESDNFVPQIEEVKFKEYYDCCVIGMGYGFGEQGQPLEAEDVEVIGNIYEHGHLLDK